MCGFVTIATGAGGPARASRLERATTALAHRGPDDFGYGWVDDRDGSYRAWREGRAPGEKLTGVLFGHRRLSILDLSDAGHQPFVSADRSLVLCYNGEIYNFLELRAELESAGFRFRSSSDTEVLLAAYQRWGLDALRRLNGMWAFTLWDARERKLVVSRDRFGVKPLYFTLVDGARVFASEIKALIAYRGSVPGWVDDNVSEFLARGLLDHDTESLFEGIHALAPASCLEIRDGAVTETTYWRLPTTSHREPVDRDDAVREFRELLADTVRVRTRSDVPIGTMLSGGLDSTAITALIHEGKRQAGGNAGPATAGLEHFHETFTACWPESRRIDETALVDLMCDRFGLSSTKLFLSGEALRDILPAATRALDEPFETPVALVQYLLMREARAAGVKVVLNGHGSDCMLGGYPEFFVAPYLAQLLLAGRLRELAAESKAFAAVGQWRRRRLALELLRGALPAALRWRMTDLGHAVAEHRAGIFAGRHRVRRSRANAATAETLKDLPILEGAMWRRFSEVTLPKWLRMEDRMSMAHSVESRLPFMDYRLVELAFRLPSSLKLHDGYTKYVLRKALEDLLPPEVTFDRTKRRFETPVAAWMRGPWREMLGDLLLSGQPRVAGYLDLPVFRSELEGYLAGDGHRLDPLTIWRVLQTEIWMRGCASARTEVASSRRHDTAAA